MTEYRIFALSVLLICAALCVGCTVSVSSKEPVESNVLRTEAHRGHLYVFRRSSFVIQPPGSSSYFIHSPECPCSSKERMK
jgi:hypothetical protein